VTPGTPAGSAPAQSLPPSTTEQIVSALQAGAARQGRQIVVQLSPPELGRVRITLRGDGRQLRGSLEVDEPQTLEAIRRETPQLVSRLAEAGIQLRRMDVSLADRGAEDSPAEWAGQDGSQPGEHPGRQPEPGPAETYAAPAEPELGEVPEIAMAGMTEGSVNIWA